jgi:hypothetical protein
MESFHSDVFESSERKMRGGGGEEREGTDRYMGLPSPPRTAAKAGVKTKGALSLSSQSVSQSVGPGRGKQDRPLDAVLPLEVAEEVTEVNVEEFSGALEHDVVIMSVTNAHHKGRHTVS